MRILSMMGATFIVFGGGAAAVGALDNVAVRGSDDLGDVTSAVLASCPAAATTTYLRAGSAVAEAQLVAGAQTVAPMSRFLRPSTGVCNGGVTAEGLVIGLDALSIVAGAS